MLLFSSRRSDMYSFYSLWTSPNLWMFSSNWLNLTNSWDLILKSYFEKNSSLISLTLSIKPSKITYYVILSKTLDPSSLHDLAMSFNFPKLPTVFSILSTRSFCIFTWTLNSVLRCSFNYVKAKWDIPVLESDLSFSSCYNLSCSSYLAFISASKAIYFLFLIILRPVLESSDEYSDKLSKLESASRLAFLSAFLYYM